MVNNYNNEHSAVFRLRKEPYGWVAYLIADEDQNAFGDTRAQALLALVFQLGLLYTESPVDRTVVAEDGQC